MKKHIDFARFCSDQGIEIADVSHKHGRPGWISVECQFCSGNPGFHLGYNVAHAYFNCWRCGWHPAETVITKLANCSWWEAKQFLIEYALDAPGIAEATEADPGIGTERFKLPDGTGPLKNRHLRYLRKRGFDPEDLLEWNLRGTGHLSSMPFRIIIPIRYENQTVSYQGRDITDRAKLRYKACAKKLERVHHKFILYGLDLVPSDYVVIVEGCPSVWRLGPGTVATFGAEFTLSQVRLLSKYRRRYIMFDNDRAGKNSAVKLAGYLSVMAGRTEIWHYRGPGKDPGDMNRKEARKLMQSL